MPNHELALKAFSEIMCITFSHMSLTRASHIVQFDSNKKGKRTISLYKYYILSVFNASKKQLNTLGLTKMGTELFL